MLLFAPARPRARAEGPVASRTAIIMPVFAEDAARSAAALAAMGQGLAAMGHGRLFELFMLSDSRDAEAALRETSAMQVLRDELGGSMTAWWCRRAAEGGGKAVNLAAFVHRWGARYDLMLVLDADSLMGPETIVEMVRRMDADPNLGVHQSNPTAIGAETAFARAQQVAAPVHGPVVARDVAAWQGLDGNFWGHNARSHPIASWGSLALRARPGPAKGGVREGGRDSCMLS